MDPAGIAQAQIEQEQSKLEQEKARENLLLRVCSREAIERLKRVKLVKKDLVEKVERFLEQQAMSGKIRSQVGDADIVELLSKIGSAASSEPKIVIARKRYGDEEDDDDDSDLK